jgi:NAD(P)-dependent dehydrogenase (short-subunit alcohol dehydrogenase family)
MIQYIALHDDMDSPPIAVGDGMSSSSDGDDGGVTSSTGTSTGTSSGGGVDQAAVIAYFKGLSVEEYGSPKCRDLRKALRPFLLAQQGRELVSEEQRSEYALKRALRKQKEGLEAKKKAQDRKYVNSVQLRSERYARLEELKAEAAAMERNLHAPPGGRSSSLLLEGGEEHTAGASVQSPPATSMPLICDGPALGKGRGQAQITAAAGPRLSHARQCYICKARFAELHHFYDQLCPPCAALNWRKRQQSVSLAGKVVVLTGGRVKIGFMVALKALRAGCAELIVTTRFPRDAAARFAREDDFAEWRDNLQIVGLDLRDLPGIELFAQFMAQRHGPGGTAAGGRANGARPGVDVIIHNACQTVRRPPMYYRHLLESELKPLEALPASEASLLSVDSQCWAPRRTRLLQSGAGGDDGGILPKSLPSSSSSNSSSSSSPSSEGANPSTVEGALALSSALLSAVPLLPEDEAIPLTDALSTTATTTTTMTNPADGENGTLSSAALFPTGLLDHNQQQVDLRRTNSWRLPIEEVSAPEATETLAINALAPFVINSRLIPLMKLRCTGYERSGGAAATAAAAAAAAAATEGGGGGLGEIGEGFVDEGEKLLARRLREVDLDEAILRQQLVELIAKHGEEGLATSSVRLEFIKIQTNGTRAEGSGSSGGKDEGSRGTTRTTKDARRALFEGGLAQTLVVPPRFKNLAAFLRAIDGVVEASPESIVISGRTAAAAAGAGGHPQFKVEAPREETIAKYRKVVAALTEARKRRQQAVEQRAAAAASGGGGEGVGGNDGEESGRLLNEPRFIVNVSAMEGKFYRHKTKNHPHTNMAKAALNMMTRTCAPSLAREDEIYMTSVDTGWINDENPLHVAAATAAKSNFQTPIDEVDAAARILDPIFDGLAMARSQQRKESNQKEPPQQEQEQQTTPPGADENEKKTPPFGVFLKDYHETEW